MLKFEGLFGWIRMFRPNRRSYSFARLVGKNMMSLASVESQVYIFSIFFVLKIEYTYWLCHIPATCLFVISLYRFVHAFGQVVAFLLLCGNIVVGIAIGLVIMIILQCFNYTCDRHPLLSIWRKQPHRYMYAICSLSISISITYSGISNYLQLHARIGRYASLIIDHRSSIL